jgi:single-stranded-DNA-specific exonuclease
MPRKLDRLVSEARRAAISVRNFKGAVRVVSHYDADGIASASIIALALSREGKRFRLSVIKQLSEARIRELAKEGNLLTIFSDLGSGHLKGIQESLMVPGAAVIILDHHQVKGDILPENAESIIHVNPLAFGISENLSGAGVAYFLAKEIDPENAGLAHLGVVGAVGDSQVGSIEEKWGLSGPNREILKDAKKSGSLSVSHGLRIWGKYSRPLHKALEYCTDPLIPGVSGSESASVQFLMELGISLKKPKPANEPASFQVGNWRTLSDLSPDEQKTLASGLIKERIRAGQKRPHDVFGDVYEIPGNPTEFRSAEEFATVLNACGKLGRPHVGVSMCMAIPQSFGEAKSLLKEYRKNIGKAISWVSQNKSAIKRTERCTYMFTGSRVSEHIISNVASIFSRSGLVPEDRPLFAFADAEDGMVKVSARAHDLLVENGMSMERLVSAAACQYGGEGGGHRGAAGATIPREFQELFISCIEGMLAGQRGPENNINTNAPEEQHLERSRPQEYGSGTASIVSKEDVYGTAKAESRREGEAGGQERGSERREVGRKADGGPKATRVAFNRESAFRQGTGAASKGREEPEKMEGQGLVRYFGPKDVQ